jgi:aspartate/methionine/tyrosine aminotransferase
MRIKPFELERWQSVWENRTELNISESGVHPFTVEELVEPAALQTILRTSLGYPQTNGSEELRARVAELHRGATAANVLMTTGGSEANFISTWALVEPGDEVVFMQPNYMQIAGVAESFGATVRPLWLREELRWGFDPADLRSLITPRTRLIAVCNPNNPTGAVLPEKLMDALCARAAEVGAWILADEIYRGAELSGPISPTFWGRYERVLCTGGLSKAYSLPGLRTGWVVGPADMVERLWGYHDYTSIGISMLTDRIAAYALGNRERIHARTQKHIGENWPQVRTCHMLSGEVDFILMCVARDLPDFQTFVTEKLTAAKNVASVKTALAIRTSKFEPGIPLPVFA